ncbi:hypothetical protein PC117_g17843 [Phytophthora cactorum]|uniref:Uncharacterized protein n=1 Tax=Phytophthora cactorum TaxID=29920 RepID=A0A8T1C3W3_9STRA|nr:hypothetical protein PC117_g17843 [Phytophthora cactorum]
MQHGFYLIIFTCLQYVHMIAGDVVSFSLGGFNALLSQLLENAIQVYTN